MDITKLMLPIEFELFGTTYTVVFDNDKCNYSKEYGSASYSMSKITLSTTDGNDKLSDDKIKQTFYHELVHSILDSMHERKLSNDEKFVDTFANLLHQYNKTVKYNNNDDNESNVPPGFEDELLTTIAVLPSAETLAFELNVPFGYAIELPLEKLSQNCMR